MIDQFVVVYVEKGDEFNYSLFFCQTLIEVQAEAVVLRQRGHQVIGQYQKVG